MLNREVVITLLRNLEVVIKVKWDFKSLHNMGLIKFKVRDHYFFSSKNRKN